MQTDSQRINIYDCDMYMVESADDLTSFSCGNTDLVEFFAQDAYLYDRQLLGKTYYFETKDTHKVIGAFTVANDSIKASLVSRTVRNKLNRQIPNSKRTRSYPAILIGRLGVATNHKGGGIGGQIVDYIKKWFTQHSNKSGCRYVVVDAYNSPDVLAFYEKNEFRYLYSSEEEERATFGMDENEHLNSRMMYFDLIEYTV
ncbi:MAG: N-acetyltransferase [Bacteroidaceae bacterium]|nr:N-acetyltransferase [Bacteroidaceae bacterium]